MSFFSNFQSDKCPGIKQIQIENYTLTLTDNVPGDPTYPLTFISARTVNTAGVITNLNVERLADKPGCARVQATVGIPVEVAYTDANGVEGVAQATITVSHDVLLFVPAPSIMPYKITAEVSAVCAEGTFNQETGTFTVNACLTTILKVAIDVEILVPSYGYCAIPPAQDYSQEVCAGFFELPLYPQGKTCSKQ